MPPKLERRVAAMVAGAGAAAADDKLFGISSNFPRLVEIEVEHIYPNPDQPRTFFDEEKIEDLWRSIESKGLMYPITVKPPVQGRYMLVDGERRWRAHKFGGKRTIFALLTDGDQAELAMIANLQREDLTVIETARALRRLQEKHQYTHRELAAVLGCNQSVVTRTLRILDLPPDIISEVEKGECTVSKSLLMEIAEADGAETQAALWDQAKQGASVRDIRNQKRGDGGNSTAPAPANSSPAGNANSAGRVIAAVAKSVSTATKHISRLREAQVHIGDEERRHLTELRDTINTILEVDATSHQTEGRDN